MFTFWDYLLTFGEEVGLDFHKKKQQKSQLSIQVDLIWR